MRDKRVGLSGPSWQVHTAPPHLTLSPRNLGAFSAVKALPTGGHIAL